MTNPKHTDTSRSGDLVKLKAMLVKCNDSGHDWWVFALAAEKDVPVLIDRIAALEAENARLREAMTAMHKDLLLRAEIDIRDGTKIVHASNGVWLKFCAALKEIKGD